MAAAQAGIAVEQAAEKLRARDQTEGVNFDATVVVHCPQCGAEAKGGKFCQECGASLAPKTECPKCGAKVAPGTKFCQECGQKLV
jgi:methionyl-tRNA synthetase